MDGATAAAATTAAATTARWRAIVDTFAVGDGAKAVAEERRSSAGVDAESNSGGSNCSTHSRDSESLTLDELSKDERALVHERCRALGLGSRSEGDDASGTRVVTIFRRRDVAATTTTTTTKSLRNGVYHANAVVWEPVTTTTKTKTTTMPAARAVAEDDDDDDDDARVCAHDDSLMDLRDAPFDVYRALKIPRRDGGGYGGGNARARASYHREISRCHPRDFPPGRGSCHGCGGVLKPGRWFHRPSPCAAAEEGADGGGVEEDGRVAVARSLRCVLYNAGPHATASAR